MWVISNMYSCIVLRNNLFCIFFMTVTETSLLSCTSSCRTNSTVFWQYLAMCPNFCIMILSFKTKGGGEACELHINTLHEWYRINKRQEYFQNGYSFLLNSWAPAFDTLAVKHLAFWCWFVNSYLSPGSVKITWLGFLMTFRSKNS